MRRWHSFPLLLALLAPPTALAAEPSPEFLESPPWKPCGTTAFPLEELPPGAAGSEPSALVQGDRVLFFTADDGVHGREPWMSSGTGGRGTFLVRDIHSGPTGSEPAEPTRVGDRVFFTAEEPVYGRELWVTDGTASGTHLVKDLWPGADGSYPQSLLELDGVLYFTAGDPEHGRELWRSDGSPEGTFLVEDLEPGPEGTNPYRLTRGGDGSLYFVGHREGFFLTLMRTDGRSKAVELFRVSNEVGVLQSLTPVGKRLFFVSGEDHDGRADLRVTSGGAPLKLRTFLEPQELVALGGRLLFSASTQGSTTGQELWRSDGTAQGTRPLKDLRPGSEGSSPSGFVVLGRRLFFSADDGKHGREPWVSDGTSTGTSLLTDLAPGEAGSDPQALTVLQGSLFFSADTPGHGREPWVSTGTSAGTRLLTELAPGAESSDPAELTRAGWDVFFSGSNSASGRRLWAVPFRPANRCD
jgi:ELWxxDGT repeat protein